MVELFFHKTALCCHDCYAYGMLFDCRLFRFAADVSRHGIMFGLVNRKGELTVSKQWNWS